MRRNKGNKRGVGRLPEDITANGSGPASLPVGNGACPEPSDNVFAFLHGLRAAHRAATTPSQAAIQAAVFAARDRLLHALEEERRVQALLPSRRRVRAAIRLEARRQGRSGAHGDAEEDR
ncbi:MAG: hypothetical protein IT349_09180 [Candidatus Eisenbacteria bacterium]|nr:hypothetical protein [Candidatus Eisenbacteria bacterium]